MSTQFELENAAPLLRTIATHLFSSYRLQGGQARGFLLLN